ncbi:hypothetical protein ACFYOF_16585 [Streptomyces sp. NPDC007148]|uniref:hypothetical protein n=1 Tax=Streptomyces sp. NPDC007148 TaxID=3364775 RepID=UPI003696E9A7
MKRALHAVHRLFRRPAVTGPYRIYVRRTPAGAMLDVEHYLTAVITRIADDPDLLALLLDISDDRGISRDHDGWAPEKLLMERLIEAVGFELALYGPAVATLADRLRDAIPALDTVPAQREAGGE